MPPHVLPIPELVLALSLLGAPLLLLVVKRSGGNSLGLPFRLSLWVMAGVALATARSARLPPGAGLGLLTPTWTGVMAAAGAVIVTLAAWPLAQRLQARSAATSTTRSKAFREIIARPLPYRLFLIVTAAVTEEVLYRGFAIGVGAQILGNLSAAVGMSLAAFVAAHFRWGLLHLVSVLWAAVVLTGLFMVTRDLWACIAAHGVIDLVGLVIAPAMLQRRTCWLDRER